MSREDIDRRDFFRLSDEVCLLVQPIQEEQLANDPYAAAFNLPDQAILISQLQSIDNDVQPLFGQIADHNRAIASYLKALDQKIECLTNHLTAGFNDIFQKKLNVDLSEGGMSFAHNQPLPVNSYAHLTLMLLPNHGTIATIAQIKSCDTASQGTNFRIGAEFMVLLEQDRRRLTRHIIRKQSEELRQRNQQKYAEDDD